jgi:hypothetical protein
VEFQDLIVKFYVSPNRDDAMDCCIGRIRSLSVKGLKQEMKTLNDLSDGEIHHFVETFLNAMPDEKIIELARAIDTPEKREKAKLQVRKWLYSRKTMLKSG